MTTAPHEMLRRRIADRSAQIGIVGLGYVGLPLALSFVEAGFAVLGFDVDGAKVDAVGRGSSYIRHLDGGRLTAAVASGRLAATRDFSRLGEPDAVLICVPTPLTPQREPDMTYVVGTAREIARRLRPGQLVVLESTTYPGTTDELLRGILEEGGRKCGWDFFLAFSPEREDPGRKDFTTTTTPKVVGGVDSLSGDLAEALYAQVVARTVRVSSARAAEATKLMENIFRAVNIALVNELKVVYERMGIDVWEVLDAASTKPFGFMRFNPGPGWGGHCIAGKEWVRIRGAGLSGVFRAEELFRKLRCSADAAVTSEGVYLRVEGVEALAVETGSGRVGWFPVEALYRGRYTGRGLAVTTDDRRRVVVTESHPMLVLRSGQLETVPAAALVPGEELPVLSDCGGGHGEHVVDLIDVVPPADRARVWVRPRGGSWSASAALLKRHFGWTIRDSIRSNALRLDRFLEVECLLGVARPDVLLLTGMGRAHREWPSTLTVTPDFARFVGYYLAEGCITRDRNAARVRLTFNRSERDLIDDVRTTLDRHGFPTSVYDDRTWHSTTIKASSLLLAALLDQCWGCGTDSGSMRVPDLLFALSRDHRRELLKGLLRGDGDVWARSGTSEYSKNGRRYRHHNATAVAGFFSSSPVLLEQVVHLLQDQGFQPSFKQAPAAGTATRRIRLQGGATIERLQEYFLGEKRRKLEMAVAARRRRVAALADRDAVAPGMRAAPVRSVETVQLDEWVYSMEVAGAASFTTSSGIAVHNCIPLDPFYLSWKAREYGVAPKFIELAGEINVAMPRYVVDTLVRALNARGKAAKGARVLVVGLAYKKDIDDPRESPAFEVIGELLELGAEVSYHDPHIPRAPRMRHWPDLPPMSSVPLDEATLSASDAVVIVTDHTAVDYDLIRRCAALVVDTRGRLRGGEPNVVRA